MKPGRGDGALVALLVLLCAAVTVGAAGTSVWLRTSADQVAASRFGQASHEATQLRVGYGDVAADELPASATHDVAAALPPALRRALVGPRVAAVTNEMIPEPLPRRPGQPIYLNVAGFPGLPGLVDVVEGRLPRPGSAPRTLPPEVAAAYDGPRRPAVVEVLLQESAVREMDLPVGSWTALTGRSYRADRDPPAVVHVVGSFRAADPYPSTLDDVESVRSPSISRLPELNLVRATALVADPATVLRTSWIDPPGVRFTFDLAGVPDAETAERLVAEARQVQLQAWPPVVPAADAGAVTGLGEIAGDLTAQRRTGDGVTVLLGTTLAGGALVVLLAGGLVLAGRREAVTTVVQARGASLPGLAVRHAGESLVLVAPGVLIALTLVSATDGGPALRDVLVACAAGLTCAAVLTGAQVGPRVLGTDPGRRRVAGDALALVLVLLAAGTALLVALDPSPAPDEPLMLVLPPLLGAALAVTTGRLLQVGLGGLRRLTRRTRSATHLVALGQAAEVARRVAVAATALVLATGAAVLAVSAEDTLHRAAERTGWEQVGADVGIVAGGMDADLVDRLRALPGVREVAPVFVSDSVSLDTRTGVEGVRLLGTDAAALTRVGDRSVRGLRLPAAPDGELTAVASPDLLLDDGRAVLRYAQSRVPVRVVARVDAIPGVTGDGSFLLVDDAALREVTDRPVPTYDAALLAGDVDVGQVARTVRTDHPQAVVRSRDAVARNGLADPAVVRVQTAIRASAVVASGLAVTALVLVVALGAATRRQTRAVLGLLGGESRRARRAGMLAVAPVVAAAGLAGAACGAVLTYLAGHALGLPALVATAERLWVRPDGWSAVAGAAGAALAVAAATLAAGISRSEAR